MSDKLGVVCSDEGGDCVKVFRCDINTATCHLLSHTGSQQYQGDIQILHTLKPASSSLFCNRDLYVYCDDILKPSASRYTRGLHQSLWTTYKYMYMITGYDGLLSLTIINYTYVHRHIDQSDFLKVWNLEKIFRI